MNRMGDLGRRAIGVDPTRRDVLKAGGLGTLGLGLGDLASGATPSPAGGAVILVTMVGGPGGIDTFDPKPDAPADVRGPSRSIPTAVPGVRVSEHLPEVARRMAGLALIRSLGHDAAPIHETGLQLLATGRLFRDDREHPHLGSVAARALGSSGGLPPFVMLPGPIGHTGVSISRGQSAGPLGSRFDPFALGSDPGAAGFDPRAAFDRARRSLDAADLPTTGPRASARTFDLGGEAPATVAAYGPSAFGRNCLLARRLVEAGARMVVINMAETVFGGPSWDAHGRPPFATFADLARDLLPAFDRGFSALVDDLKGRGLLASTLLVATGEFGRTPRINESGGRDHWPGAWSALLAGGGTAEGRVIGATDRQGAGPVDRPVVLPELVATMAQALGLDPAAHRPALGGGTVPIVDGASPIAQLS